MLADVNDLSTERATTAMSTDHPNEPIEEDNPTPHHRQTSFRAARCRAFSFRNRSAISSHGIPFVLQPVVGQ
jgi:hypothetical protein